MIKFFRHIRQRLVNDNKFSKYLLYAVGEIILVVVGILIALQLNTNKENKNKSDLGYQYLTEMRTEVQSDFFNLDRRIRMLDKNIKKHEAALRTKNINDLPLDSLIMVLTPVNLDFEISELTFNRMKNLGLTSVTDNEALNSKINTYYNSSVVSLKLSMDYVFEELRKYEDYFNYGQDFIDWNLIANQEIEFPALYNKSKVALSDETRRNSIQFITSNRGRTLVLRDLANKRYSLRVLKSFKARTLNLLEAIYNELKDNNPQTEPLAEVPLDNDFVEMAVAPAMLEKYVGVYQSEADTLLTVFVDDSRLYLKFEDDNGRQQLIPSAEDRFFMDIYFVVIQFNREKGVFIGLSVYANGKLTDFRKVD